MGVIWMLALGVLGVMAASCSRVLADEFKAWAPWIINFLVRRAVDRLPQEQRERYAEEWGADIAETPGDIGKLIRAVGFQRAARKISEPFSNGIEGYFRTVDIVLAGALLIMAAPVMIFAMTAQMFDLRRPMFFKQMRVGKHGKLFWLYKFRTFAADGTLTPFGLWLRRSRVDELPYLISVLRGDMSLVGPMADSVEDSRLLSLDLPDYSVRFTVRPGLTGWSQVNLQPWQADPTKRHQLDVEYLKRRSIFFDLWILLRSFVLLIWPPR